VVPKGACPAAREGRLIAIGQQLPRVPGALEDLPPSRRRLLIGRALLRALLTAALLVAGYYLLPLDKASDLASLALLVGGGIVLIGVIVWQVRSIIKSPYPGIRAIQSLATVVPLLLLTLAATYYLLEQASAGNFSQPLSRTDALYFTVTTFTTVGYGDITPVSDVARLVVVGQMITDLVVLGFGVKVFVGAVRMGQQRQSGSDPGTDE
jgi:voltage-gated potassium channel